VLPTESFLALATAEEQWRAVAALQHEAHQVEAAQTTLLLAEEKLRAACAAEETAQHEREATRRLRDEFLSIASHELRNPVAGLSLHAQLALRRLTRDGHLDLDWGSQALHAITGQATRITRLLDQLLDVSRLETGAMALERREIDLTALVTQAVAEARVWSQRHTIDVVAPPLLAARLDPFRLEQALANLLHNAIKYTPPGGTIEVILSQPRPDQMQIVVRDNGPGIPPEARDRVFDRFASANASGPTRGLGLGLYLSRQIVQLHGGELALESPPEGGTRFVIRMPASV
jgi:signal transduction histidine kinase